MQLFNQNFNLKNCIDQVIKINSPVAIEKGIAIEQAIPTTLNKYWYGDKYKIQQILTNLVGNAVKFTKEGNVLIKVAVEQETEIESILKFEVKDTGIGIPESYNERLFDAFTQIDNSTTRTQTGTGLGLAICKQLVELMNGQIWFESRVNIGTSFFFTIPLRKGKNNLKSGREKLNWKEDDSPNKETKILLVEDDRINQILAEKTLNKLGYSQLEKAANGQEAVEMVQKGAYDIVLMDLQMPVMDGLKATQLIRKGECRQPVIIAMTANVMPEDKARCLAIGMNDFLPKPINVNLLKTILEKYE